MALCSHIATRLTKKPFSCTTLYTIIRSCKKMNDPLEHATGLEKKLMLAEMEGNDDPFNMRIMKRGPGTKDNPNLIPSAFEGRLVGCICDEEQTYIEYMWLMRGEPKRCECGHWFSLIEKEPLH